MVNKHIRQAIDELEQAHEKCDGLGTRMMIEEEMGNLERIKNTHDD
jgi:hypothetical protein